VLTHPEEVAALIDDPILKGYLLEGGVTQVGELYEVVATLEAAKREDKVEGSAIYRMFQRHFKKRTWTVPETIAHWKRHVEAHPPDSLTSA